MVGNVLKIFTGNSNPDLAREVVEKLDVPLGRAHVGRFSDGEINVTIGENVRSSDVFLIQSTCAPSNENLMELLVMLRCASPRIGRPHLRRAAVLRLRAAGPKGRPANPDHRQAGGGSRRRGRCDPGAVHRHARGPDPGVLQRSFRPPVRDARAAGPHAPELQSRDGDREPRRGRRRAGAGLR